MTSGDKNWESPDNDFRSTALTIACHDHGNRTQTSIELCALVLLDGCDSNSWQALYEDTMPFSYLRDEIGFVDLLHYPSHHPLFVCHPLFPVKFMSEVPIFIHVHRPAGILYTSLSQKSTSWSVVAPFPCKG